MKRRDFLKLTGLAAAAAAVSLSLSRLFERFGRLRGGRIILIQTKWHEDDLYERVLSHDDVVDSISWANTYWQKPVSEAPHWRRMGPEIAGQSAEFTIIDDPLKPHEREIVLAGQRQVLKRFMGAASITG